MDQEIIKFYRDKDNLVCKSCKAMTKAILFYRKDTYANMVCSLANIRFEMISVLYNIGAIHTQLGARTERTSADGMKMACTHFQCAAWAFEHLKNSYPQPPGVDLAPELMTFMYQLCLAQGQECILEKSMLDNRKPSIVGMLKMNKCLFLNHSLDYKIASSSIFDGDRTV